MTSEPLILIAEVLPSTQLVLRALLQRYIHPEDQPHVLPASIWNWRADPMPSC